MIAQALLASTAIILLSFVSEDAATISSALSLFGGPITWPLGFAACFAGIWVGDLALYVLARCFGRPILKSRWIARFADAKAIKRCQTRFNNHAALTLLASRFVPGTRLPTYLAAGLLSMPVTQFAAVTAFGALLWIGGVFISAKLLGSQMLTWLPLYQGKVAAIVVTAFLLTCAFIGFRRLSVVVSGGSDFGGACVSGIKVSQGRRPRLQLAPVVRRWVHWEFWPAWLFYIPVGVYYGWLAIRHGSLSVPTSANPGIETGGFIGESKLEILNQLRLTSPQFTAEAFLIEGQTTSDRLLCLHRICREYQ